MTVQDALINRSKSQVIPEKRNSRKLQDHRSCGMDSGEMPPSARELMDADFNDEIECQSDNYGRAPPIEVQFMQIDN